LQSAAFLCGSHLRNVQLAPCLSAASRRLAQQRYLKKCPDLPRGDARASVTQAHFDP
jgi:hypothetical protein